MAGFGDRLRAWFGLPPRPPFGAPPAPAPSAPPPERDPLEETMHDERLPDSSLERVLAIRSLIAELDRRAHECGLFDEMHELQRLKTGHLPSLLLSYVEIPPEHRAEVFRETGRSASFLLNERLDKILARLHEMSRQLARGNLNDFAQNIRFVDMQYGSSNNPFD